LIFAVKPCDQKKEKLIEEILCHFYLEMRNWARKIKNELN